MFIYKIKNILYSIYITFAVVALVIFCFSPMDNMYLYNLSRIQLFISLGFIIIQFFILNFVIPFTKSKKITKLLNNKNYEVAYSLIKKLKDYKIFKVLYLSVLIFCGKIEEFYNFYEKCDTKIKDKVNNFKFILDFITNKNIDIKQIINPNNGKDLCYKIKYVLKNEFEKAESKKLICNTEITNLANLMCEQKILESKNQDTTEINNEIEELKKKLQLEE